MFANTRLHVTSQRHDVTSTLIAIQCNSVCAICRFLKTGLVDHIGVLQTPNALLHFCLTWIIKSITNMSGYLDLLLVYIYHIKYDATRIYKSYIISLYLKIHVGLCIKSVNCEIVTWQHLTSARFLCGHIWHSSDTIFWRVTNNMQNYKRNGCSSWKSLRHKLSIIYCIPHLFLFSRSQWVLIQRHQTMRVSRVYQLELSQ